MPPELLRERGVGVRSVQAGLAGGAEWRIVAAVRAIGHAVAQLILGLIERGEDCAGLVLIEAGRSAGDGGVALLRLWPVRAGDEPGDHRAHPRLPSGQLEQGGMVVSAELDAAARQASSSSWWQPSAHAPGGLPLMCRAAPAAWRCVSNGPVTGLAR